MNIVDENKFLVAFRTEIEAQPASTIMIMEMAQDYAKKEGISVEAALKHFLLKIAVAPRILRVQDHDLAKVQATAEALLGHIKTYRKVLAEIFGSPCTFPDKPVVPTKTAVFDDSELG